MTVDLPADVDAARRLLGVIAQADSGCRACVAALCLDLIRAFPGDWVAALPDADEDGFALGFELSSWQEWLTGGVS